MALHCHDALAGGQEHPPLGWINTVLTLDFSMASTLAERRYKLFHSLFERSGTWFVTKFSSFRKLKLAGVSGRW